MQYSRLVLAAALLALLAAACRREDDDADVGPGLEGEGEGEGRLDAGDAGDAGEGEGEGPAPCPPAVGDCPDRAAVTWPAVRNTSAGQVPVRVIIEAIDFAADRIVLRSVADEELTLSGWDVILGETMAHPDLPEGTVLPAGERFVLRTLGHGQDSPCESWAQQQATAYDLKADKGEAALRTDSTRRGNDPDYLEAFVRWGGETDYDTVHRDEADAAGLWTDLPGQFVPTTAEALGIVAVGDVSAPEGWAEPAEECLGIPGR